MNIYLIRHGETEWNVQGRFQGREDIPLNDNGRTQAHVCAQVLMKVKPDCIVSSPMQRALETAKIIAKETKVKEIIISDGLTERDLGKLSGLNTMEREDFHATGEDAQMENWDELIRRSMESLHSVIKLKKFHNVIMVSHGATINALLAVLSDHKIGTGKTILKNTCINTLEATRENIVIKNYNLLPHEFENIAIYNKKILTLNS